MGSVLGVLCFCFMLLKKKSMDFDYQPTLCFCMTTAASDLTECQTESEKHYNDTVSVMLPVYNNSVDL